MTTNGKYVKLSVDFWQALAVVESVKDRLAGIRNFGARVIQKDRKIEQRSATTYQSDVIADDIERSSQMGRSRSFDGFRTP